MKVVVNGKVFKPLPRGTPQYSCDPDITIDGVVYGSIHKKPRLLIWYMRDNHTFSRVYGRNISSIRKNLLKLISTNKYGMLCKPKVLGDNDAILYDLCSTIHMSEKAPVEDIKRWLRMLKWSVSATLLATNAEPTDKEVEE